MNPNRISIHGLCRSDNTYYLFSEPVDMATSHRVSSSSVTSAVFLENIANTLNCHKRDPGAGAESGQRAYGERSVHEEGREMKESGRGEDRFSFVMICGSPDLSNCLIRNLPIKNLPRSSATRCQEHSSLFQAGRCLKPSSWFHTNHSHRNPQACFKPTVLIDALGLVYSRLGSRGNVFYQAFWYQSNVLA